MTDGLTILPVVINSCIVSSLSGVIRLRGVQKRGACIDFRLTNA